MPGYANRVIKLDFPDLSADWDADPIWVIIRNPRLMPTKEITSSGSDGAYDDQGNVLDRAKAEDATDRLIAKLVVAHRVYDATAQAEFDPFTGEAMGGEDQPLLPLTPWGPETAAKLPTLIRIRIAEEFTQAQNPGTAPGDPTGTTSSGQPSPSTTEPGTETPSQPS